MAKQSSLFSSAATLLFTVISSTQAAFTTTSPRHCFQTSSTATVTVSATASRRLSSSLSLSSSLLFQKQQQSYRYIPKRNPFTIRNISNNDKRVLTRMFASTRTTQEENKSTQINNHQQETNIINEDILLLPYVEGSHNSIKIIIDETNTHEYSNMNKETFKQRLQATITTCRTQLQKSSLWISIPMSHASFIEAMNDIPGLEYHNANGKVANLSIWLQDNIENKIPEYATHQVGVGAMVVNSKQQILCVRELKRNYRPWKIPGGLAELGENLDVAAIREVKEETGVDCTFQSVLMFRHTHGMQFQRSDLYFVCRMEAIESVDEETDEVIIPEPIAQVGEIAAAKWVPFDEYREMVNSGDNPHPMMQKVLELYDNEKDIERSVISSIVPGRKPSPIYHAP